MAATVLDVFDSSPSPIHTSDGVVSAGSLAADGRRLAASWRTTGIGPGDRVAVHADNSVGYLRCIAAAAAGSLVLVSVNRRYSVVEARALVERSGASLVVTDADASVFQPADMDRLGWPSVIDIRSVTGPRLDSAVLAVESDGSPGSAPDDPFIVFTTSGTTSRPKMVLHTQRSIADHSRAVADHFGHGPNERVMVALPLCGVFGFNSFTAAVAGGSDIWVPERFEAHSIAELVAAEGITALNGSDDMFHRLLETSADLSTIRVGGYGRFNSSLDGIVERADAAGVTLTGLYGMSEVQALFALRNPDEDVAGRERAGGSLSSPDADFRIASPEGSGPDSLPPPGTDGELLLAGPSLFAGYLAEGGDRIDADLTASAHVELDGRSWFRTGDLARAEEDGTFTFLTRMGDVLRLGGFLVNPAEIEAVVNELPGIEASAAVALARPGGVRAAVAVIADHDPDSTAVIAHCAERLARFKVPVAVVRVSEFPTTPSANGTKIRVNELRAMVEEAVAHRPVVDNPAPVDPEEVDEGAVNRAADGSH
jgi:fatty-acyl-CoA synthase